MPLPIVKVSVATVPENVINPGVTLVVRLLITLMVVVPLSVILGVTVLDVLELNNRVP